MGAVDVGVGHDDDLVVAELGEIEIVAADLERGEWPLGRQRFDLGRGRTEGLALEVGEHRVDAREDGHAGKHVGHPVVLVHPGVNHRIQNGADDSHDVE